MGAGSGEIGKPRVAGGSIASAGIGSGVVGSPDIGFAGELCVSSLFGVLSPLSAIPQGEDVTIRICILFIAGGGWLTGAGRGSDTFNASAASRP